MSRKQRSKKCDHWSLEGCPKGNYVYDSAIDFTKVWITDVKGQTRLRAGTAIFTNRRVMLAEALVIRAWLRIQ